jgi:hypothetical protein
MTDPPALELGSRVAGMDPPQALSRPHLKGTAV